MLFYVKKCKAMHVGNEQMLTEYIINGSHLNTVNGKVTL